MCKFFNFKNNWLPVWAIIGKWMNKDNTVETSCTFTIEYSENKNRYRLKTSGDYPEKHQMYVLAIQKLNYIKKHGHLCLTSEI